MMSRPMRLRSLSDGDGSSLLYNRIELKRPKFQYSGWVFHLGTNKIGHEFCHPRFLFIRGKYVEMYKRDPHQNPGIRPIRRGVVGHTLMVEELGCRKVNCGDVYVLRFYNRLDESKKGEIACATAGEAQKWLEAFDQAKQQAEYELSNGGRAREKLNLEAEIDLDAHRHRVRKYAHGFIKLIKIRQDGEGNVSILKGRLTVKKVLGLECLHIVLCANQLLIWLLLVGSIAVVVFSLMNISLYAVAFC